MADLATKTSQVAQKITDLLNSSKEPLGLALARRGGDSLIEAFPAAMVTTKGKLREFKGAGAAQYKLTFEVWITVMTEVIGAEHESRDDLEALAEAIDDFITKTNRQLDGLVIHGFIISISYGTIAGGEGPRQAVRMIWQGTSQESIN